MKPGKHNLKDPRLDQADQLVEADKKTHAQVELIGDDQIWVADAILASREGGCKGRPCVVLRVLRPWTGQYGTKEAQSS